LPVLIGLVYLYGSSLTLEWLIGIPILIVIQFAVVYGLVLMISVANAYFRDLEYLVNVLINLLFWMTPIVYPLEAVPESSRMILVLNPVTYLIQAWRDLFFNNTLNWNYISISLVTAVIVLIAGLLVFKKFDKRLDEVL